jgi:Na+-translocating ferredoxin:NAD+ oxidoreductase subunit G
MQPNNEGILKKLYPIILLTIVILASVITLSFTNAYTKVAIEDQAKAQTQALLVAMFPDMTDFALTNDVYVVKKSGATIGYAFIANGKGYGGTIQILVGLKDASTLKGISIIAQSETQGMGSRVTLPKFTDQFAGKAIADVKIKSEGGQIDGISGSTISSKGVINAVRETALAKVAQLPK